MSRARRHGEHAGRNAMGVRTWIPFMAMVTAMTFPCRAEAVAKWPRMAPLDVRVGIDTQADRIDIAVPLFDSSGIKRYLFSCHGGNAEYIDSLTEKTGINFVRDMMCLLTGDPDHESESSLLAEDGTAPWHTRGQFQWQQLAGACGAYPEFGRVRHFILRGFELTLEAENVEMIGQQVRYFRFHIAVRPFAGASRAYAKRPGYLRPSDDCKEVRVGEESRMCRNWKSLRYEECRE